MTALGAGTEALRKSRLSEKYSCAQRLIRRLLFAAPCWALYSPLFSVFRLKRLSIGGGEGELKQLR